MIRTIACVLALLIARTATADDWRNKVSPHVLLSAKQQATVDVIIRLGQSDYPRWANPKLDYGKRKEILVKQLQSHAKRAQQPLRQALQSLQAPYRAFWVANLIAARVTPAQLRQIAMRSDVVGIESDGAFSSALPKPEHFAKAAPKTIPWNLAIIHAPEAWNMGYRGRGVIVGGQDTGYQWDHPALRAQYLGWQNGTVDHNYHWHDAIHALLDSGGNPCGLDAPAPCDDHNHGTHTMGSMVGEDGANQIGVAPEAKWIGCRNMERGVGRPSTYIECFQWFLAPTDLGQNNPDPSKAPQVIGNSWGCPIGPPPGGEDCAVNSLQAVIANVRAAGIVVVVAAGNSGSSCSTINSPPAIYADSFVVANSTAEDGIYMSSSRGPVTVDGSNRLKPDIAAPGTNIISAINNGMYTSFTGTSMATPHVVGVIALMLEANPALRGDPDHIEQILKQSAAPLADVQTCGSFAGAAIPNALFGHGRIDAYQAVQGALAFSGIIFANGYE